MDVSHCLNFIFSRNHTVLCKLHASKNSVSNAANTLKLEAVITLPHFHNGEFVVKLVHNFQVEAVLLILKTQLLNVGFPATVLEQFFLIIEATEEGFISDRLLSE